VEGWRQGWRRSGTNAAICAYWALGVRQGSCLRTSLAAVLFPSLLNSLMMLVIGHGDHFMCGLFGLSNRHRSAALKGHHRDRKPQEKAEERAHDCDIVPQIKRMHQGTASWRFRRDEAKAASLAASDLGLVSIVTTVGLYRYSACQQREGVMPKITILPKTNLQEDCWHSMLISLLRGLAALMVAAAHLRALVYPGFGTVVKPPLLFQGLAFSTGFAYLAVIVFFVLSGWLVGGSFLNKLDSDRAFQNYAIDRISRLWVVLVPTFLVVLLVGAAVGVLDGARVSFSTSEPYSVSAFFGNMIGLQTIIVPPFGGNFPLWSLANETWYYVLFPLMVLVFRSRTIATRAAALLAIGAIIHFVHSAILLYFSIWLLGAAFSRIKIEAGPALRWVLLLLFVGSAVLIRMKGKTDVTPDGYPQYLIFSLIFVLFLSSMQFKRRPTQILDRLDSIGQFFANFSFTLYVLHVPLIAVMAHVLLSMSGVAQLSPYSLSHYVLYAAMYLVLVVGAYAFYLPFESNTPRVRQWLKTQFLARVGTVQP